ncbi:unnamed protein product, partial [Discosporangium mesarthrocarpum]
NVPAITARGARHRQKKTSLSSLSSSLRSSKLPTGQPSPRRDHALTPATLPHPTTETTRSSAQPAALEPATSSGTRLSCGGLERICRREVEGLRKPESCSS